MFMFWVIVIASFLCGLWPVGVVLLGFLFAKVLIGLIGQIFDVIKDLVVFIFDLVTEVLRFVFRIVCFPFRLVFRRA